MPHTLPQYELRLRRQADKDQVWGLIRKRWFVLTPEEFVRQNLLHFLVKDKGVSASLISVEKEIPYHDMRKRFDVVVFDREAKAYILCECKAPHIELSQEVIYQIMQYNVSLQAPHLLLTNGKKLLFFSMGQEGRYEMQEEGWLQSS